MILCLPLSHSRIRRTTRDPPQISNHLSFVLLNLILKIKPYFINFFSKTLKQSVFQPCQKHWKSKLGLCLYHSSSFLPLDFSSSLLGDPSLLPKLSLPHSSRIVADYMLLHAKKAHKHNQGMRKITKKRYQENAQRFYFTASCLK